MRSKLTPILAAISLGVGIAGASAATLDHQVSGNSRSEDLMALTPNASTGFSAIGKNEGNGRQTHALFDAGPAGHGALTTATVVIQSEADPPNPGEALKALRQLVRANPNGLAALTVATGQRGASDKVLQHLVSEAAKATSHNDLENFSANGASAPAR